MVELRTFAFDGTSVVAVRGELDDDAVVRTRSEIVRCLCDGSGVVVDLLNAYGASERALDALLPQLRHPRVTIVAERRLFDRFDLPLVPTLAAALI